MIAEPDRINLAWLLRLRFGAISGQLVTISLVHWAMHVPLPLGPLLLLIAVELCTNLGARAWLRGGRATPRWLLPGIMVLDVLVLTGLLYFTGGPLNPFSFLYLVQIALAAVVLPERWTWTLVALSAACSAVLFLHHHELRLTHEQLMATHLRGMWVAFSVAASFIVYFLMRVQRALRQRDAELQAARHLAAQQERLASLATLAAGAAHELATPLSTIALVARELERGLTGTVPSSLQDVRLIRAEVERCRVVLEQMAADAGQSTGEGLVPVSAAALAAAALHGLPEPARVRLEVAGDADGPAPLLPLRALGQAVRGLLKNALEASAEAGDAEPVQLRVSAAGGGLRVEVSDRGAGMAKEVAARAGEPFFTTKAPGRGMGLGLFLTRAVVERVGGRLTLLSTPGHGTRATVTLPAAPLSPRSAQG